MRTSTPVLLFVTFLFGPLSALAPAAAASPADPDRGLWMEFKMGAHLGNPGSTFLVSPSPGFILGYRTGRLLVGAELGGQWGRSQYALSDPASTQEAEAFTVKVMPVVQVDLLRSGAVRLYLTAAAGVSYSWFAMSGDPRYRDKGVGVVADLGFGIRYFLAPRFAVGAEAAATGSYFRGELLMNGATGESRNASVGVRAALSVAFLL